MRPLSDERDYKDADQLAAAAGVSPSTIWRLKLAGQIPFYQPGGKRRRVKFPPDAFERRCIDQRRVSDDAESRNLEQVHEANDALKQGSGVTNGSLGSADSKGKQPTLSDPMPKWMQK